MRHTNDDQGAVNGASDLGSLAGKRGGGRAYRRGDARELQSRCYSVPEKGTVGLEETTKKTPSGETDSRTQDRRKCASFNEADPIEGKKTGEPSLSVSILGARLRQARWVQLGRTRQDHPMTTRPGRSRKMMDSGVLYDLPPTTHGIRRTV